MNMTLSVNVCARVNSDGFSSAVQFSPPVTDVSISVVNITERKH